MSKYKILIFHVLKENRLMSTNEVAKELQNVNAGKIVNWHMLYKILDDLSDEGKIEKIKTKAGYFWKLR